MRLASEAGAKARRSWKQRIVITLLAVVAVSTVGAAAVAFFAYDQATRIDRGDPDLVVTSYLRALLNERDEVRAGIYVCANPSELAEIRALREQIEAQERDFGVVITVSLEDLQREESGQQVANVAISIRRAAVIDGVRQSVADRWRFRVVNESGWRVCGATKTA
jgi:hypothetical protein